ncbi:MAG: hypothetical protein ACK4VI_07645 [Alphaproteobacteria bacterium]
MSNFTKSIFFSGMVLVAGLVAVFTIYNNMSGDAGNFAAIEPASGYEVTIEEATDDAVEAFEEAVDAVEDAVEDAEEAADEATEDETEEETEE